MFSRNTNNSPDVHIEALTFELAQYKKLLKELFSEPAGRFLGQVCCIAPEAKIEMKHDSHGSISRITTSLQQLDSAVKATTVRLASLQKMKRGEDVLEDEYKLLMKLPPLAADPAICNYAHVKRTASPRPA